jgi:quercetin dioxygenase-like cupin family protein
MEETGKGYILSIKEIEQAWRIEHKADAGGGHHNMQGFGFLTVASEAATHGRVGLELAKHLMLGLDIFPPGGGIKEHRHIYGPDAPIFDHAYYVISGKIKATVGDVTRTVGHDSLIYCPSNIKHSILNVGKTTAKVLRIAACNEGAVMGGWVKE